MYNVFEYMCDLYALYIMLYPYFYFSELQRNDQKVCNLQSYESSEQI